MRFIPYDLLRAIRRGTSGRNYDRLRAALDRLRATTVWTNVRGDREDADLKDPRHAMPPAFPSCQPRLDELPRRVSIVAGKHVAEFGALAMACMFKLRLDALGAAPVERSRP